jgi:hypothetical protein
MFAFDSLTRVLFLYSGIVRIPKDDVPQRISEHMFMTHALALFGSVAAVLYIISYLDDQNHAHKIKTYQLNVLTLFALYFALAGDTVYQFVNENHLCSDKYFYTDHFGKEVVIPCDKITTGLVIVDIIMICLIPLWRMAMDSIYRFAISC